jgi:hypothetical protein
MRSAIQVTPIQKVIKEKPKLYDTVVIDLTNAGQDKKFGITGDNFYVFAAPSSLDLQVRFNETDQDLIPIAKGDTVNIPFHQFFLTWPAQAGQSVTLLIGKDLGFEMKQLAITNIYQIQQPVKQQAANSVNMGGSPVAVYSTVDGILIRPARDSRQSCTVIVESENMGNSVAFGIAGVTYAGGAGAAGRILVQPGQSYTFYHNKEIRAICPNGETAVVGFEEEFNT